MGNKDKQEEMMKMKMSGAKLVVEALKKEGVDVIFGYPGGVVIPIFDELYKEPAIHVILTRHEQGAVHAADGLARSTGKVGVCLVTSGPGATNTITGIATANFDSVPMVVLAGQVPTKMIGNDAFQEADTSGITRPVTKHNYLVTDRNELAKIIKEAFYLARTGRPGPVVIDLPKDILLAEIEDKYPDKITIRGYNPVMTGHSGQIRKAALALKKAKKPLFFVGGGVIISEASEIFNKLLKKTGIPVITSLMGIGAVPYDNPLNLGMVGMHGTYPANTATTQCDLLFGIGTRFDDRVTGLLEKFAPNAKIIHIDIDPAAIARNVPVAIPIVGDAKLILEELCTLTEAPAIDEWLAQVEGWKKEHPLPIEDSGDSLTPYTVINAINNFFPDAIIATEVGQNQMWTALYYRFNKPRTLITSGGLGTMGFGFPAAIGAQVANKGRTVIDIAGDGSIQMNIQELGTAMQEGLPVIIAILNNGYLGMVRQWQELFQGKRYSSTCLMRRPGCPGHCTGVESGIWCKEYPVDFVKLAEAYGAIGIKIEKPEEILPALQKAKEAKDRPVILDFRINRESNVWPIVPPGAAIGNMLLGKEN